MCRQKHEHVCVSSSHIPLSLSAWLRHFGTVGLSGRERVVGYKDMTRVSYANMSVLLAARRDDQGLAARWSSLLVSHTLHDIAAEKLAVNEQMSAEAGVISKCKSNVATPGVGEVKVWRIDLAPTPYKYGKSYG